MKATSMQTYQTTFRCTLALRARIDEVRLARARAQGALPPTLADLINEALRDLLDREAPPPRSTRTARRRDAAAATETTR